MQKDTKHICSILSLAISTDTSFGQSGVRAENAVPELALQTQPVAATAAVAEALLPLVPLAVLQAVALHLALAFSADLFLPAPPQV